MVPGQADRRCHFKARRLADRPTSHRVARLRNGGYLRAADRARPPSLISARTQCSGGEALIRRRTHRREAVPIAVPALRGRSVASTAARSDLNRGAQGLPTSQAGPPPSMNSGRCGHGQARRCHAVLHTAACSGKRRRYAERPCGAALTAACGNASNVQKRSGWCRHAAPSSDCAGG
jgi:hypothetical protein